MNDYFEGALTATGGQMYTNLKTIFPGGGWIATLPTDKTDKKSFADSLADWFKSYLTKVEGQLGENGRSYADSLLQKLNRLDDSPPVVSKSQIGSAVVNSLNGLFQTLDAKTIAAQPEMRDFRDACYSLGMGLVAVVENSAKAQAGPLSEDLNEIRLRDTAAAANELVGDLPKDLQFRSTDTPSSYFREIGCYDSPSVKIDLFLSNNTGSCAKEFLTNLQSYESNKAGRGEAMLNMATVLQNVLDQTTELAEGDKPEASTAAVLAGILVETTRGALKTLSWDRGGTGVRSSTSLARANERMAFGAEAVESVKGGAEGKSKGKEKEEQQGEKR